MHFTVHKQKVIYHCFLWETLFTLGIISPSRLHGVYLYLAFHCLSLGIFYCLNETNIDLLRKNEKEFLSGSVSDGGVPKHKFL